MADVKLAKSGKGTQVVHNGAAKTIKARPIVQGPNQMLVEFIDGTRDWFPFSATLPSAQ